MVDRITAEDSALSTAPGFAVRVFKRDAGSGALVPPSGISGCDAAFPGVAVGPGDRIVVQVEASYEPLTPIVSHITGERVTLRASHEVVVQG